MDDSISFLQRINMQQKPVYIDIATHIPAFWANAVSDLVFDVFALARTVPEARQRLGLGSIALQNNDNAVIEGGSINNTVIGGVTPQLATFLNVMVTELAPQSPASLTSKQYVDGVISETFANLNLQDMSRQRSNAINITGGYGLYDVLRVRNAPATPLDVLTLGYYQTNIQPTQGVAPFLVNPDNRTITLPFPASVGRLVLFVDGIYQLPDQYETVDATTLVFNSALPIGSTVGGFRL